MKAYLLVGFGGMFGSIARYMSSGYFLHAYPGARFPWGTFFVNILGCLLIGIVAGQLEKFAAYNTEIRLALITGFLGGFTTFSAFSIETLHLLRDGAPVLAMIYVLCSLIFGVLCAYAGLRVAL